MTGFVQRFRFKLIRKIWDEAMPISNGDPLHRYLVKRGLKLEPSPSNLRFHPNLRYAGKSHRPAMLARMESVTGTFVAIHRTFLSDQGDKAQVMFLGEPSGAAVRLYQPKDVLALGEGVETSLSFFLLSGVPAWATGSAVGLESVIIPAQITTVFVCVDNDDAGRRAASRLAQRLTDEGRKVLIADAYQMLKSKKPMVVGANRGFDFNDVLNDRGYELANDNTVQPAG
jgi:putative DNA primase/helicase